MANLVRFKTLNDTYTTQTNRFVDVITSQPSKILKLQIPTTETRQFEKGKMYCLTQPSITDHMIFFSKVRDNQGQCRSKVMELKTPLKFDNNLANRFYHSPVHPVATLQTVPLYTRVSVQGKLHRIDIKEDRGWFFCTITDQDHSIRVKIWERKVWEKLTEESTGREVVIENLVVKKTNDYPRDLHSTQETNIEIKETAQKDSEQIEVEVLTLETTASGTDVITVEGQFYTIPGNKVEISEGCKLVLSITDGSVTDVNLVEDEVNPVEDA